MRTIRINRAKWLNGSNSPNDSFLWDSVRQQGCCLGHVIHQTQRCPWNAMDKNASPEDFLQKSDIIGLVKSTNCGTVMNSNFSMTAMEINDDTEITNERREEDLTVLFLEHKIRLQFYGEYAND